MAKAEAREEQKRVEGEMMRVDEGRRGNGKSRRG